MAQSPLMQPAAAIDAFAHALSRRDAEASASVFAPHALFEMPLLGQRLVGSDEIRAGIEQLMLATEACEITISDLKSAAAAAIGEGHLRFRRRARGHTALLPMSLVVETSPHGIARLSVYLDAFAHRLWCDGLIASLENSSPSPESSADAGAVGGARRALEQYCDAFQRRAAHELAALFAEQAILDVPLLDGRITGAAAIEHAVRAALLGLKEIRIALIHVIERDTSAFAEGVFSAQQVGVAPRVDGSPQLLEFKFVAALELAGGKIARWTEYFDTRPLRPRERVRLYPITRRSPYWDGTVRAGVADFMVYNHTYFPLAYRRSPAEEYVALTERVTLWDVACERQTELRGPDALELAQYLTTRDLSALPVGGCQYTLVCDPEGRIMCDPVLLRPWKDVIWLSHGDVDLTLWARGLALGGDWDVQVLEPDVAPLQIQGPRSLDVLRPLVDAPIDELGYYKCMVTRVAGVPAVVSRTGWSGGVGYEVFPLQSGQAMHVWNSIVESGRPFDLLVTGPNINRAVERNVTDTSYYSNSELNPYESGQARLVDLEKGEFIGRDALRQIARSGAKRRTVGLRVEGELPLLEWYWPIASAQGTIGEVRWACHSYALDGGIAIGVVDAAVRTGDAVRILHSLGSTPASVAELPFVK